MYPLGSTHPSHITYCFGLVRFLYFFSFHKSFFFLGYRVEGRYKRGRGGGGAEGGGGRYSKILKKKEGDFDHVASTPRKFLSFFVSSFLSFAPPLFFFLFNSSNLLDFLKSLYIQACTRTQTHAFFMIFV